MRFSSIKSNSLWSWPSLVILLILFVQLYNCQFIAHINTKLLKGNITFELRDELNNTNLVIESLIESVKEVDENIFNDEKDYFGTARPILFEWSLHSNLLLPSMLISCSNEDLGAQLLDKSGQSLFESRPIVLNKPTQWTVPLKEFLDLNLITNLSQLIWGKSIKIRLKTSLYTEQTPATKTEHGPATQEGPAISKPKSPTNIIKPANSIGLIRPSLSGPSPPPSAPASKPTFAPRARPNLLKTSTTSKPLPRSLPKREAIVLETSGLTQSTTTTKAPIVNRTIEDELKSAKVISTNTSSENTKSKDIILDAVNKYILKNFGSASACSNVIDTRHVKTAEAIFESQISGKITLRSNEDGVTLISHNLYHIKSKVSTRHDWKILSSDILDNRRHEDECKYLQVLFDPDNTDDTNCKRNDTLKCKMGDLTKKHGQIQIAGLTKNTRSTSVDLNLPLTALEGSRSLFIVLFETSSLSSIKSDRQNILSCAQIKSVQGRKLEALYNMDGVRGSIKLFQRYITEPTTISYDLFGLEGNVKYQTIHELPLMTRTSSDNSKLCSSLGDVFDPFRSMKSFNFGNNIRIGNLSARHGPLSVIDSEYEDHYNGEYLDLYLQLFGIQTVVGRSIVLHKNNGDPWVCSTIDYVDEPISLAVAKFYYPVVGQISFQQLAHNSHSETGVLVDVYHPNGEKSSDGHNWLVHLKPAMADFYNWSQRCDSSGEIFDPIQVASVNSTSTDDKLYAKQCSPLTLLNEPLRCRLGDLSIKSGFKLSLPKLNLDKSRYYYTDPFLPLSKLNSIVGKSVVIYDDNSPTQRGNRLACSTIKSVHPLKASIKSWNSGPSIPSAVLGSVKFEQESPAKVTKINIDLTGFNGNVENYAIHNVWTMDDKEFPCSNDSLYDIYDPYDSETSLKLPPSAHYGSSATVDRVKVGDMSRKHGTFEGAQSVQKFYLDSNAPLFASRSIIGRSMVLRAAVNDFRWVCGNIELDYDKNESREIIGLASFHEPRSKIAGYVRFFQLEHKDGSLSDTYVHIDLRMQSDGIHELQTSESHNWAIFVNQVGEDAFITADDVRCIAAGFKWNPYLAQDTLETYPNSCTINEHQACAMGDLGMRHGLLTLGPNNRRSVSDSNLPLAGNYSIMGRSLIIFDNKRPTVKLACANIYPDIHLKSNVVIKRTPSFTVARFVEQMRELLGAAEWLMVPELKATKPVANGECVQMTIHFYGQKAHQMQIELNNLITLGTVSKSTRIGVDKISTHYKLCRAGQMQLPSTISSATNIYQKTNLLILIVCLITTTFIELTSFGSIKAQLHYFDG